MIRVVDDWFGGKVDSIWKIIFFFSIFSSKKYKSVCGTRLFDGRDLVGAHFLLLFAGKPLFALYFFFTCESSCLVWEGVSAV